MNDKIVYFQEGQDNGCNFYRIRQPARKIIEKGLFKCATSSLINNLDDQTMWIDKTDILVSQMGGSEKYLDYVIENKGKKKFVLDYDDNIFSVSIYNPSYRAHGTRDVEVEMDDGTKIKLWEDGKNGFSLAENQNRLFVFSQMLKAVDMVTTPSPVLAGVFKKMGANNVRVIRNYLDLSVWSPIRVMRDNTITIGYQGGWSHYEDWLEIKDAIKIIMNQYPNVRLLIMGQAYLSSLKDIPKDRIKEIAWTDIGVYPHIFKTLGIDIGIAPLADGAFNFCKSELKWEEYSSLEIPCVASNKAPYSMAISHGKTGFLAKNTDEWVEYLGKLIESESLRKEVGLTARKKIEDDYDLDKNIVQYKDAFESMFGLKKIISLLH